ncbi:TPA: hypothetical protein ACPSKB_002924 [Legionella feeleii]|uniref:C-type lysozyme inhibitor domain-containing protein n=1 Tax=Legionella feeleii TaxID=453 RepID=A0A378IZ05_9GAMM|nr:hypothetical protein [Legionella feeleii]STX37274.1 Uncharacterised protein [Legionella feeleii]
MNKIFLFILLFFSQMIVANAAQKSVSCVLQGLKDPISFVVPSKADDLPQIDFPYAVKTILFSLRDKNLLLVAVDKDDASRMRIFLSAQAHTKKQRYDGQFMADYGGNQLQLDNGPVSCEIK